LDGWRCHLVKR